MAFVCYGKSAFCHFLTKGVIPVLSVTSLICNIITLWILSRIKFPFSQHLPLQWLVVCHIMCSLTIFAAQIFGFVGILMHNSFLTLGSFMIVTLLIGGWCQLNIPTQIQFWSSPKVQHCWFIACYLWAVIPAVILANFTEYCYLTGIWRSVFKDMIISSEIFWYLHRILPNVLIIFFVLWFTFEPLKDHLFIIPLVQTLGVSHMLACIPFTIQRFADNLDDLFYSFQLIAELLYLHLTFAFLCFFNTGFRNDLLSFVRQKREKLKVNQPQTPFFPRRYSVQVNNHVTDVDRSSPEPSLNTLIPTTKDTIV